MLGEIAVFQKVVERQPRLHVVERTGQELSGQQPHERIGEGTVILAVQGGRQFQGLGRGDVGARLAVARSREQQHMMVWIGRRRRAHARRGVGASDSQVTCEQGQVAGAAMFLAVLTHHLSGVTTVRDHDDPASAFIEMLQPRHQVSSANDQRALRRSEGAEIQVVWHPGAGRIRQIETVVLRAGARAVPAEIDQHVIARRTPSFERRDFRENPFVSGLLILQRHHIGRLESPPLGQGLAHGIDVRSGSQQLLRLHPRVTQLPDGHEESHIPRDRAVANERTEQHCRGSAQRAMATVRDSAVIHQREVPTLPPYKDAPHGARY